MNQQARQPPEVKRNILLRTRWMQGYRSRLLGAKVKMAAQEQAASP